jgi:hypothetical protein
MNGLADRLLAVLMAGIGTASLVHVYLLGGNKTSAWSGLSHWLANPAAL